VRSQPQLDAPWHCAEKVFECRRVPFAVNPVQIRGALRRTLALVITVLPGVPFTWRLCWVFPQGTSKEIAVDAKLYDGYVGHYEVTSVVISMSGRAIICSRK